MKNERIQTEEWKKRKQQECRELLEKQKNEIRKVLSNGNSLADFLYHKGRLGLDLTMGNAALVLAAFPKADRALSLADWKQCQRWVNKGEKGIPIVEGRNYYWRVNHIFEYSQTHGKKLPEPEKAIGWDAVERLIQLSPVSVVVNSEPGDQPVSFDGKTNRIYMSVGNAPEVAAIWLSKALVEAQVNEVEKGVAHTPLIQFYAESIYVLLAGGLGLKADDKAVERLDNFMEQIDLAPGQAMLEEINRYARVYEERIWPPQMKEKMKSVADGQRSPT